MRLGFAIPHHHPSRERFKLALTFQQIPSDLPTRETKNRIMKTCVPYLTNGGVPSTPCCNGVGELRTSAVTTADRQAACNCVKQAAARIPTIKEDDAATLPAKCHVQVDFPISKNTNCEE
ncbi:hypothetical protein Goklo_019812 [Gossypium klotzschianum]|uniref:Non-specific lipid-transfer protein n=1 Tax=Gossypium klotzschianum TaxID=34286 RepID=A0A7J8UPU7_9ROSI|nr:hypothetical protein [Gossypium klotzschianum]